MAADHEPYPPQRRPRVDGDAEYGARPAVLAWNAGLDEVVAVRHGESTANARFAATARSHADAPGHEETDAEVPLSAAGVRQSARLGRRLAETGGPGRRPWIVAASPYVRARQTWESIAAELETAGVAVPPVVVDERLRDRETGVHELLTPAEVRAASPQEAERRRRSGEWFYRPPGGESIADVAVRVRAFLVDLAASVPADRQLLVVTHDSVVQTLRQILAGLGAPPRLDLPVPNASVSRWRRLGRWISLVEFGCTAHLDDGEGG
ncbi:histidine phosphatase family protein [Streptomyces xiaopingdaonensis]|uniref:histidine phosphatase family protein n=1 Tax=Streptomyces xiaopingdaonensis TaxID=1565415 RepID=UPI00030A44E0|nr:histidine phosphatase family protein [Streptomyces xiaopingdaonensis]